MKKYIVIAMLMLASLSLLGCQQSQKAEVEKVTATPALEDNTLIKDGVRMIDSRMMMVKNGIMSEMTEDITMSNGTKVMTDGTVILKDGTTTFMQNAQMMDLDGKISTEGGAQPQAESQAQPQAVEGGTQPQAQPQAVEGGAQPQAVEGGTQPQAVTETEVKSFTLQEAKTP